jgi:hypothetical protein
MIYERRLFKLAAISMFLLGTITIAVGYSLRQGNAGISKSIPAFRVVYHQFQESGDSKKRSLQAITERQQQANGEWKEVVSYLNSDDGSVIKKVEKYAVNGRGLFKVDEQNKKLVFLGMRPDALIIRSSEELRKDSEFVREESILGYQTFVLRQNLDESNYTEVYTAPDLQGIPLRIDFVSDKSRTTIEAVEVDLSEDALNGLTVMPDYPIDYGNFEKSIQSVEKSGNNQAAEQMRQGMNNLKNNQR